MDLYKQAVDIAMVCFSFVYLFIINNCLSLISSLSLIIESTRPQRAMGLYKQAVDIAMVC